MRPKPKRKPLKVSPPECSCSCTLASQRPAPRFFNVIGYISDNLLIPILDFFYGLVPSYGLAIVALTLVIRIALYPLSCLLYTSPSPRDTG